MTLTYDPVANVAYLRLQPPLGEVATVEIAPDVFVDVDEERGVVLIHILDASDPEAFRRQQENFYNRYQRKVFP